MLAFIDESGLPNPNDKSDRPVVAAVCYDERDSRTISRRLFAIKRRILQAEQAELKGLNLLKEKAYRRSRTKRIFAEEFFSVLETLPITVFAMIMQGPFQQPLHTETLLGNRFRFLLQRIEMLAAQNDVYANILFDGRGTRFRKTGAAFSSYLFRSAEGQASVHIADAPAFVDSATSSGIQIADMCAYVIRVYQENRLFETPPPPGDEYLHAIRRWYRIIQRLTRDWPLSNGQVRYGFHRLPAGVR